MENTEFTNRYITPFYMEVMNLNFTREVESHTLNLFKQLQVKSLELNDSELIILLNDNWRPSKAGAWMIGISKRIELFTELVKHLSKNGVHHSEHLLINLLILDKEKAKPIIVTFIEQQVTEYLTLKNDDYLKRYSIEWALSILAYLDKTTLSQNIQNINKQIWWIEFIESLKKNRYYKLLKENFDPNFHLEKIEICMQRIEYFKKA